MGESFVEHLGAPGWRGWRGHSGPNGLEARGFRAGSLNHKGSSSSRERVSDGGRSSCRASSGSALRGL